MTTPDLRFLTSGPADFSEELIAHDESLRMPEAVEAKLLMRAVPDDVSPPDGYPASHAGPKWRLNELKASVRRLSEMVPNELERIRRRRVQWLGDLA